MVRENRVPHYVGIALAVFVGVFAARFLYAYVVTKVVVSEIEALGEQVQKDTRQMQERNARDSQRRREEVEQQRRHSNAGRDFYRRCAEYTEFYRNHPSEYAYEQREKACSNYTTYVQTGKRAP
jgi:hypothetical protein